MKIPELLRMIQCTINQKDFKCLAWCQGYLFSAKEHGACDEEDYDAFTNLLTTLYVELSKEEEN